MLKNNLRYLFDFFLPRLCTGCEDKLKIDENTICSNCYSNLELASTELLQKEFERKFKQEKYISGFTSCYIFQNDSEIQKVIHSLKYNQRFQVGRFLGGDIAKILRDKIISWEPDLIIPIPLHSLKKAERGFNQADHVANGMGKELNLIVNNKIIKRIKFTQTQTKLTLKERKENMDGAFQIKKKNQIKNKNIILVDDVITTGATISECAKLLIENGANKIFAVSVAIAE